MGKQINSQNIDLLIIQTLQQIIHFAILFFLGLELGGFLGLMKSHNEVASHLFHCNATRPITSEELTTLFEYNFMKFEGSEGNANQEMHEKAMAQSWKLLLKSIPSKSYPILSKTVFLMGCIAHVIFNIYKIVLVYPMFYISMTLDSRQSLKKN